MRMFVLICFPFLRCKYFRGRDKKNLIGSAAVGPATSAGALEISTYPYGARV